MSAKKTMVGVENVYAAAGQWVDNALRNNGSIFTPEKAIWSAALLQELRSHFLDRPDFGDGGFYDKLKEQLSGCSPDAYQLMAEALYVQFLVVWHEAMGLERKKSQVEQVLAWGASASSIPVDLVLGLTPGIASSLALTLHRPYQVGFIIEFAERWKELSSDSREELLADEWKFKDFAGSLKLTGQLFDGKPNSASAQRQAILHLVHPDKFEGTVSVKQKNKIASTNSFAHFVSDNTDDVDRRLAQIRAGLESDLGRDFDFYDEDIRPMWETTKGARTGVVVTPPRSRWTASKPWPADSIWAGAFCRT